MAVGNSFGGILDGFFFFFFLMGFFFGVRLDRYFGTFDDPLGIFNRVERDSLFLMFNIKAFFIIDPRGFFMALLGSLMNSQES